MLIGLTGARGVGKSTIAKILVEQGWRSAHAFAPGKEMCAAYYRHLGAAPQVARRMVDGDLKDTAMNFLPGMVSSRYFMERLGNWMATNPELGIDWTLGAEIERLRYINSTAPIVVESVVYEADLIREMGGEIVRVICFNNKATVGEKTDSAQDAIREDSVFVNNTSLGLDWLREQVTQSFKEPLGKAVA